MPLAPYNHTFSYTHSTTAAGSMRYIAKHTKPCPKCKRPIERSDGCNKMHCECRAGGCGVSFCWMCLGTPFESAHNYPKEVRRRLRD